MRKMLQPSSTTLYNLQALGLHAWWEVVGTEMALAVCESAELSFAYFRHLCYYTKPCTPEAFERIEAAAKALTPHAIPDYETCTRKSVRLAAKAAKQLARNYHKFVEQEAAAKRAESKQHTASAAISDISELANNA